MANFQDGDCSRNAGGCSIDMKDILKTLEPQGGKKLPQNRLDQYKQHNAIPSQEERRRQFLESVKDRRQDFLAQARLIAFGEGDDEEEEEDDDCNFSGENQDMDTTSYRDSYHKRRRYKPRRYLKNQLMLSEWLVQLPEDFQTEWLMVPCPLGKRCLVVSSRGRTKVFSRLGQPITRFSSLLPGGNRHSDRSTYSILDCIFCKDQKLFYVMDIMCWQGHPVYDCDTSFRFFWLQTKLEEVPDLKTLSDRNQNIFIGLNHYACNFSTIQQVLSSPIPYVLDGLIFFHKASPYQQGVNPLIGWLKAFMVSEIMPSITVPEFLCSDKPQDYVSIEKYLAKVSKRIQQMDCDQ